MYFIINLLIIYDHSPLVDYYDWLVDDYILYMGDDHYPLGTLLVTHRYNGLTNGFRQGSFVGCKKWGTSVVIQVFATCLVRKSDWIFWAPNLSWESYESSESISTCPVDFDRMLDLGIISLLYFRMIIYYQLGR